MTPTTTPTAVPVTPMVRVSTIVRGTVAASRAPASTVVARGRPTAISASVWIVDMVAIAGTTRTSASAGAARENPGPKRSMIPIAAPPPTAAGSIIAAAT